jgi:hypothetical protein
MLGKLSFPKSIGPMVESGAQLIGLTPTSKLDHQRLGHLLQYYVAEASRDVRIPKHINLTWEELLGTYRKVFEYLLWTMSGIYGLRIKSRTLHYR